MNIGVVSMLSDNYGALLQSYALQTVLEKFGNSVSIVNRRWEPLVEKVSLKEKMCNIKQRVLYKQSQFDIFRNSHLHLSKRIRTYKELVTLNNQLDLVITGSDQVWHEGCSKTMGLYFFLDWVDFPKVKRYSYAASFGKETFSADEREVSCIRELLQTYSGISVRELSGIDICKNKFSIDAVCHLDPTLLLDSNDYDMILEPCKNEHSICCYMLDKCVSKEVLVDAIAKRTGYKVVDNLPNEHKVPVEVWIQNIRNAKYVITDSFHGMVFSVIYNKNFICINNKKRGTARFISLLGQLGLLDRLVDLENLSPCKIMNLFESSIDYVSVNQRIHELRADSLKYLKLITK